MYTNVTVGADPEFFLKDKSNGHLVSAIDKIGGSKEHPRKIDEYGSCVQEDNVAVEYNIPPATTKEQFVESNFRVLKYLEDYVGKLGLEFSNDAAALFPHSELKDLRALVFGCEPDFNVWTRDVNPSPMLPDEYFNLRSAGGHVHVGWENPTMDEREELIMAMDVFVGAPAIELDKDTLRRKLYGKAGAFRIKDYGAEYRTLSNFWIQSKESMEWVFDRTINAVAFLRNGGRINLDHMDVINDCINNGNKDSLNLIRGWYPV